MQQITNDVNNEEMNKTLFANIVTKNAYKRAMRNKKHNNNNNNKHLRKINAHSNENNVYLIQTH